MPKPPRATTPSDAAHEPRLPRWSFVVGLIAIMVSFTAAGALSWQHLTGHSLPGCGGVREETSGTSLSATDDAAKPACASLEAHPMGSIGGMQAWLRAAIRAERIDKVTPDQAVWPVSLLGTAYFAGSLASWLAVGVTGRRLARSLIWVMRLGVLASLAYLAAIVLSRKYCQYCITAHAGNLAWLAVTEFGMKFPVLTPSSPSPAPRRTVIALLSGLAAFAVATAGLGYAESGRRAELSRAGAKVLADSTSALLEKVAQDKAASQASPARPKEETPPWGSGGFTGRWPLGPREAKVRVVMITDFQCPDCKRNDAEALALLEKYKGQMSLSTLHFPMCTDCNKRIVGDNPHPNACWAARAAETAGLLAGTDGFLRMHKWLFEKSGSFTDPEFREALPKLGFTDPNAFLTVMQTDASVRPIHADLEIADALGLFFTPMIFVNGVEFRGWQTPNGLTTAVEAAFKADPPVQGPTADHPPLAREKFVADWREMPVRIMPAPRPERVLGKPEAQAAVVVFGDYTEPNTKRVDDLVRTWAGSGSKAISYAFVHYPGDKACNPSLPRSFFPFGCAAAKAAEAAGQIGGPEMFWKMHQWLLGHRERIISLGAIREGGASIGIDPAKLDSAMSDPKVNEAVQYDVNMSKQAGVGTIPAIFVNGKLVQRWTREGDNVLERIVDEAAARPGSNAKGP